VRDGGGGGGSGGWGVGVRTGGPAGPGRPSLPRAPWGGNPKTQVTHTSHYSKSLSYRSLAAQLRLQLL